MVAHRYKFYWKADSTVLKRYLYTNFLHNIHCLFLYTYLVVLSWLFVTMNVSIFLSALDWWNQILSVASFLFFSSLHFSVRIPCNFFFFLLVFVSFFILALLLISKLKWFNKHTIGQRMNEIRKIRKSYLWQSADCAR